MDGHLASFVATPVANDGVSRSIARARRHLLETRDDAGGWHGNADLGPIALAMQLVVESHLGVLSRRDADEGARGLVAQQQPDGGWVPYPHAPRGTASATALGYAALVCCGRSRHDDAVLAARHFLDRAGGLAAVVRAFRARGDLTAVFLLLAGLVPPDFLPKVPLGVVLAPLDHLLERSVHAGNMIAMLMLLGLGDRARHRGRARGWIAGALHAVERRRVEAFVCEYQNPDGNWNGVSIQTLVSVVALAAVGGTPHDPPIARALDWLATRKRYTAAGLAISPFDNDVWSTALGLLALEHAGERCDDSARYLLDRQIHTPQPRHLQRKRGARRTGGWAFGTGNDTMPDTDDAGVVLAALGHHAGERAPREVIHAIDDGVAWIRAMQNPDGGWPSYTWGLPSKRPGPMFARDLEVGLDDPRAIVGMFLDPPPEYGDPSIEGVTGRVLWGLGACGVGRDDPAVCAAIDFLRYQQCDSGAFWGRYKTCYAPETATILTGLAAIGEDLDAPYVRRARDWLLSVQNPDGGFGETPEAYVHPERAGRGPSMPAISGYALAALVDVGAPADALDRAAAYLVGAQDRDGGWPNAGFLHTFVPPDVFYTYDFPAASVPLLALAKYAKWRA